MHYSNAKFSSHRAYFSHLSKEDLLKELSEIMKRFPQVKQYYQSRFNTNAQHELLEQYKKKLKNQFFPDRGFGKAGLSVARKVVTDYKKIASNKEDIIDLMLFYVEQGVLFTFEYGDIDEPFYNSMESMYVNTLQLIKKENLLEQFRDRCKMIVDKTSDMGWGFHDTLADYYEESFGKYE